MACTVHGVGEAPTARDDHTKVSIGHLFSYDQLSPCTDPIVILSDLYSGLLLVRGQAKTINLHFWCLVAIEVGCIDVEASDAPACNGSQSYNHPVVCRVVSPCFPAIEERSLGSELSLHAGCWADLRKANHA